MMRLKADTSTWAVLVWMGDDKCPEVAFVGTWEEAVEYDQALTDYHTVIRGVINVPIRDEAVR